MTTRSVQRVRNGLRKVASGLRPFGESVWPGVRNDLFVAHESIYRFSASYAVGASVLDAGCGTGYGSRILADSGAREVLGVDVDRLSVAFARRRYADGRVRFERADCEALAVPAGRFGFVFASNVLEHLSNPERFLSAAFEALRPGGRALFAVPPITSLETAALHRGIHYHRSNLTVEAWHGLVAARKWSVSVLAHTYAGPGPFPDFASPFPSGLSSADFAFTEVPVERFRQTPAITALFLAAKPEG
ncbi:MAG: class I SAM-dependent methyltransferase [Thermoanaerobaculia bacterium]